MVSSGVVALVIAAFAQAVYGAPSCGCGCGPVYPPVFAAPAPVVAFPAAPALEEGCCPGPVVEKKSIITKSLTVPYCYTEPTFSKQCFQRPAGVDRKVIPAAYESAPVCETQETIVKVPTTDVQVQEQPLVRKTCTTSEYVIQIPIVETTCTSAPLCKKTVRTQDNVLTTVSKKTSCAKKVCTQNKVVEQPFTETVCQNYQGAITKSGAQTVLKPEVVKSCVQLPPRKCLKPATGPGVFVDYGNGPVAYGGGYDGAFAAGGAVFADAVAPGFGYGGPYVADGYYGAGPYVADGYYGAGPYFAEAGFYGAGPYVADAGFYGAGSYVADAYAPGYYGAGPVVAEAFAPGFYGAGPVVTEAVVPGVFPTSYLGSAPGPVCTCVA